MGSGVDPTAKLIRLVQTLVGELHPRQETVGQVALDSALERDLGLDSLARVELLVRIERAFAVTLPEQTLVSAETPRDLLVALRRASAGTEFQGVASAAPAMDRAQGLPVGARTLTEVLYWHEQAHPDRPHIRLYQDDGEGEILTYGQLREGAESLAAGLQAQGLQRGEPVAIMLPSGGDYFRSFFGILMAGGIPVPVYPPVRMSQIEDHLRRQRGILSNCLAAVMITVSEAKPIARLLRSQVQSLREVVTVDELMRIRATWQALELHPEDIAFLQYTSGSTGNPKGVVLTHANLLANIRVDGQAIGAQSEDVFVSWLPLYHDMGLIGAWLGSLYHAVLLVVMSPLAFLSRPQRWLWAIHRYGGTLSAAPNFAYELCLTHIDDQELQGLDLSSWRLAFNGAEAVSPDTVRRFGERFSRYGFDPAHMYPVYGLAECSLGLAFPPLGRGPVVDRVKREPFMRVGQATQAETEDTAALRFLACGQPLPDHEIRIVDSAGGELPERREGRLQFRGPSATSGYYRNPDATRQLFQGDWLESGDLAYMADGDVYITGRVKDLIIRAGRNIYPQEVEEAVGELPGVRKGRVVVFGSSEPGEGTERLVVLGESREEDSRAKEELRLEITRLTTDLIGTPPDDVVLAPPGTVLKTSSGKLRRAACRELYEQGRIGRTGRAVWWQLVRLGATSLAPAIRRGMHSALGAVYAGYAWTVYAVLALAVTLGVLVLPRAAWRWAVMHKGARILAYATGTPLVVTGLEHLPRNQTCILVANHSSYLDGYVLTAVLPVPVGFVAKAELAERWLLRLIVRRTGTELVHRLDKQQSVVDAGRIAQQVRVGRSFLFFPEGTFTRTPGLAPFRMGAFLAAVESEVPVVPIAIRGTRSMLRAGSWWPRRGAVVLTVGKPLKPDKHLEPWQAAVKLREAARNHIRGHCGEADLFPGRAPPSPQAAPPS